MTIIILRVDSRQDRLARPGIILTVINPSYMSKILVPCDFSGQSMDAFRFALELAKAEQDQIELLHVIELPVLNDTTLMPTLSFEAEYMKEAAEQAKRNFQRMIKPVKKKLAMTWSVEYGNPASTILFHSKKKKSDLIVMGTKGASGLKEYFVGSNTEKIVRQSPVPVVAVPAGVSVASLKNIIFPTLLIGDNDTLMNEVKELQETLQARLHVVFINTPAWFRRDRESQELLEKFAKRHKLSRHTLNVYNDISEEEGIVNFASRVKSCMVVMGTHGRRGIGHLLTGSVTEDVVNHIKFPVWTFRTGRKAKG